MTTAAFITGEVLRWARERAGLSVEDAAKRVNVRAERVQDWEDEKQRPTLKMAQSLAHKLNVPFAYLFLSEPPVEALELPDLRSVGGRPPARPSPELLWIVNDALSKQDWYRDNLEESGAAPLPFIGRYPNDADPMDIAASIRSTFRIDDDMRAKATSWDNFLTLLVRESEAQGLLVLRSGIVGNNTLRKLEVAEFRGFAIVDDLAPVIFVNSRDAKVAQIFTLAHEIAHLWIGESGISNPDFRTKSNEQGNPIERLCDEVAAEVLAPADRFLQLWSDAEDVQTNLNRLTRVFRISRFVLLRRAFELGKVGQDLYWDLYDELMRQSAKGSSDEGGNFYNNLLAKSSTRFATSLLSALAHGAVSYREAAQLLNIKVGQLDKLRDHLAVT